MKTTTELRHAVCPECDARHTFNGDDASPENFRKEHECPECGGRFTPEDADETEAVTKDDELCGLVVNGHYLELAKAENSEDRVVQTQLARIYRAVDSDSYSLKDAPLKQYTDDGSVYRHYNLTEKDL